MAFTYLYLVFTMAFGGFALNCTDLVESNSIRDQIERSSKEKSKHAVELSDDSLVRIYELAMATFNFEGRQHEALVNVFLNRRVYYSKNYRPAQWELTKKDWDTEKYPMFFRSNPLWVIAFNLETGEIFRMVQD